MLSSSVHPGVVVLTPKVLFYLTALLLIYRAPVISRGFTIIIVLVPKKYNDATFLYNIYSKVIHHYNHMVIWFTFILFHCETCRPRHHTSTRLLPDPVSFTAIFSKVLSILFFISLACLTFLEILLSSILLRRSRTLLYIHLFFSK